MLIIVGGLYSVSQAQQKTASASMRISAQVLESSTVSYNLPSNINIANNGSAKRAGIIKVQGSEKFNVLINLPNRVELTNKENESLLMDVFLKGDNTTPEKELFYNFTITGDKKAVKGEYSGNLLATIEYI